MCLSTEELLNKINKFNDADREENEDENVMFSQDFGAMFTSLHIPTVCQVATDEFYHSDLQLDVDAVELGLYLAIVYDRQHLVDLGLAYVTHTRRYNRGPKPGITTAEILSRSNDTVSKLNPPLRLPTTNEKKLSRRRANFTQNKFQK